MRFSCAANGSGISLFRRIYHTLFFDYLFHHYRILIFTCLLVFVVSISICIISALLMPCLFRYIISILCYVIVLFLFSHYTIIFLIGRIGRIGPIGPASAIIRRQSVAPQPVRRPTSATGLSPCSANSASCSRNRTAASSRQSPAPRPSFLARRSAEVKYCTKSIKKHILFLLCSDILNIRYDKKMLSAVKTEQPHADFYHNRGVRPGNRDTLHPTKRFPSHNQPP